MKYVQMKPDLEELFGKKLHSLVVLKKNWENKYSAAKIDLLTYEMNGIDKLVKKLIS